MLLNSKFKIKTHRMLIQSKLALGLLLIPVSVSLAAPQPGERIPEFRALTGQTASNFQTPGDVSNIAKRRVGANLVSDRYQQTVNNADVLGGQLTVYRNNNGESVSVIGAHYPNLTSINEVKLTGSAARAIVAAKLGEDGDWRVKLMINPDSGRVFYSIENQRFDSRWIYWVDAEDGTTINAYNGLTTGTGIGVQGDVKDLTGLTMFLPSYGVYIMRATDGRQITYDAQNRFRLPGRIAFDADDAWNTPGRTSPGQPALVDAHFFARVTDNYYLNVHSFDWKLFYPQGMVSSAHLQRNYNNAYWNGTQMAYGDGDGITFIEFSGDLDVVGHELTHGVTEATSDLVYQNESGALNEAFSDIMGAAIEFANNMGNWTVGEDITPGDNGIRNMADPNEDGDPSHYADRYIGPSDNGGVHTNSGIANHWFYLLVNGGQNANPLRASGTDVVGIGLAAAEEIAFLGFTALNTTANYCAARASTIAVAGGNAANVADAWDEVGVNVALCGA